MTELIGTIFHLTDMHLCVERDGALRENTRWLSRLLVRGARKMPGASMRNVLAGSMWHREPALEGLRRTLPLLLREETQAPADSSAPIVVLQGGDVEALGSWAPRHHSGYTAFPSFDFVHTHLSRHEAGAAWLDVFGNHDTWPGMVPVVPTSTARHNRARIATVPGLEGPWPAPVELATVPVPLVVARVNTVAREPVGELLAYGAVSEHPPDPERPDDVMEQLTAQLAPWRDRPAVRVVLLHHPVHYAEGASDIGPRRLDGAKQLARCLSELRVQLVIAGHVHALDPPAGEQDLEAGSQSPLEYPTAQLVAETPTQDWPPGGNGADDYAALPTRSFCRYRLLA